VTIYKFPVQLCKLPLCTFINLLMCGEVTVNFNVSNVFSVGIGLSRSPGSCSDSA
jgi:hypothetical protein